MVIKLFYSIQKLNKKIQSAQMKFLCGIKDVRQLTESPDKTFVARPMYRIPVNAYKIISENGKNSKR